ncbi:hypothetical protein [Haloprofundus salilacus]|uniref:hypothetical protein n=1 Tax=Haloprofundus salilacus TaxID=2876190 RepID=UPI001CCA0242|nr:hypothetical protein [Haloprofundus salilacus]
MEDSAAATTFDGSQLTTWVYSADAWHRGVDGHRGREDGRQKLNRERRFLKARIHALASAVGLNQTQIDEVQEIVLNINSGAFTSYGHEGEGGGQDAHIIAAIAFVGNCYIQNLKNRMQNRSEFQAVVTEVGMSIGDMREALSQLHKQIRK